MQKQVPYHDFHFIIDARMRRELLGARFFPDNPGFSGLIVRLLRILYPLLEKEHFSGMSRQSRYRFVHEDRIVERCSVHVYLPENLYQRLKLVHHNLDFYSMAQVVRWVLRVFLGLVERYRGDLKRKLKRFIQSLQNENKAFSITKKKLRQLLIFLVKSTQAISLINLYGKQFTPVRILKC